MYKTTSRNEVENFVHVLAQLRRPSFAKEHYKVDNNWKFLANETPKLFSHSFRKRNILIQWPNKKSDCPLCHFFIICIYSLILTTRCSGKWSGMIPPSLTNCPIKNAFYCISQPIRGRLFLWLFLHSRSIFNDLLVSRCSRSLASIIFWLRESSSFKF